MSLSIDCLIESFMSLFPYSGILLCVFSRFIDFFPIIFGQKIYSQELYVQEQDELTATAKI